jgi:hypothetical protein
MDKKIALLLGVVATLASAEGAQAATPTAPNSGEILQARSFGDLLTPIPNAGAVLRAIEAQAAAQPVQAAASSNGVEVAQYHHHHHHHHHSMMRRLMPRPYHHHHHHHHHHYRAY